MTRQRHKGFTLIELLAVISIIMILVAILIPTVRQAVRQAERSSCQNNIKQMLRGCLMYAQDARWHRTTVPMALPNANPTISAWSDSATGNPACLWLLIKSDYCGPGVFICPGVRAEPAKLSDGHFGANNCHYSYISMVPRPAHDDPLRPISLYDADPALVIVADKNPRIEAGTDRIMPGMEEANSFNHGLREGDPVGQNIGRLDESVQWTDKPTVITGSKAEDWIYQSDDPDDPDPGGKQKDREEDGLRFDDEDVFLIP